MNREKLNTIITIIYFVVAIAYCYSKAIYNETPMYILISLLLIIAFIYYKINTVKLNLLFCLGLVFASFANFFHVKTDYHSLIYGTALYFLFNVIISIITNTYTFNLSYKKSALHHLPITLVFIILQTQSYYAGKLSSMVIATFYVQLIILSIIAYQHYVKAIYHSSFLMLFGVVFLLFSYAFGGVNKLIIQNPYYSFVDSFAFAVGVFLVTKTVIIEDFHGSRVSKIS